MSGESDDKVEIVVPYTFRFKFSKLALKGLEEAAKDEGLSKENFLKRTMEFLEKYYGSLIEEMFIAYKSGLLSAEGIGRGAFVFVFNKVREEFEKDG